MYIYAFCLIIFIIIVFLCMDIHKNRLVRWMFKACIKPKIIPAFIVTEIEPNSSEKPIIVEEIHEIDCI